MLGEAGRGDSRENWGSRVPGSALLTAPLPSVCPKERRLLYAGGLLDSGTPLMLEVP